VRFTVGDERQIFRFELLGLGYFPIAHDSTATDMLFLRCLATMLLIGNVPHRRKVLQLLAAATLGGCHSGNGPGILAQNQHPSDHVDWVAQVLKRIQTITVGMSRDDLMRVFTIEGGLSTGLQRTFVSQDCPYFKIDVTFRRASTRGPGEHGQDGFAEFGNDIIESVSKPYLQFSIMD
jgi:hypothetical protein